jgi:hypothetical protein
VSARPMPGFFYYKKLIYYFILSSYSGEISFKDVGMNSYYFLTAIFSEGKFTNKHEVVPLAASVILYTFLPG